MAISLIISLLTLAVLLGLLTYYDIKYFRLPNILTLLLVCTGLGHAFWLHLPLQDHLIGAAIGYVSFVVIETGFLKLRGYPGLGRGDAKLLAGGGAWTGWFGLPFIVLMASLTGLSLLFLALLSGRLKRENMKKLALPFGPFLSAAIFLVWYSLILSPQL